MVAIFIVLDAPIWYFYEVLGLVEKFTLNCDFKFDIFVENWGNIFQNNNGGLDQIVIALTLMILLAFGIYLPTPP